MSMQLIFGWLTISTHSLDCRQVHGYTTGIRLSTGLGCMKKGGGRLFLGNILGSTYGKFVVLIFVHIDFSSSIIYTEQM